MILFLLVRIVKNKYGKVYFTFSKDAYLQMEVQGGSSRHFTLRKSNTVDYRPLSFARH